ncbi:MAG: DUF177 domain-containing protein [Myxococcales bacterium]|nr:DUF177 domain-containing protein [Myxococcales bacterium]MCB9523585.1 DUF177 domain-containing protein [Myxococcales bacterium]
MARHALSFKFRLEELTQEGRAFEDEIAQADVAEAVEGLVGALGYRALKVAQVTGTAYRVQGDEVVIHGSLATEVGFDCGRCLNERVLAVSAAFNHLLVKRKKGAKVDAENELVVEDDLLDEPDVEGYDGEHIDLTDLIREDLVLAMPMNPTCEDVADVECQGPALPEQSPEETIDPRWAPLLELKKKLT